MSDMKANLPLPSGDVTTDQNFWLYIKNCYTSSPNIMNLNNGGVCPQPKVVQEAFESYNRFSNEGPAYYMWNVVGKGRDHFGRRAKFGGTMCYDRFGYGYVVAGSRHVIHYY